MQIDKLKKDYQLLASYACLEPDFVQGSGGNVSVKDKDFKLILVKSSGTVLSKVLNDEDYVLYSLKDEKLITNGKPSIEALMHYILGRYVIHSHPILVGALVCAREAPVLLADIFCKCGFEWHFIPYISPGLDLKNEIQSLILNKKIGPYGEVVLFLGNHGLVVSGSSIDSVIALHEKCLSIISNRIGQITVHNVPENLYLTPDHALFRDLNSIKTFASHVYGIIGQKGWTPSFLTDEIVQGLNKRPDEIHRQKKLCFKS